MKKSTKMVTITRSAPLITNVPVSVINGKSPIKTSCSLTSPVSLMIVSQLVRSPSVYFNEKIDKNGRENYDATIIPNRGEKPNARNNTVNGSLRVLSIRTYTTSLASVSYSN
jgi:hypothetical protein